MNKNVEQLMIIINSVDSDACVKYSRVTGEFYVLSRINYKDDGKFCNGSYKNTVSHQHTINDAIIEFYKLIQGKTIRLDNVPDEYKLPIII